MFHDGTGCMYLQRDQEMFNGPVAQSCISDVRDKPASGVHRRTLFVITRSYAAVR
jgi:hypothetical protein